MSTNELKRRLRRLEERSGGGDVLLQMAGGGRRVLHVRDPLGIILDAFRRKHAQIEGLPEPRSQFSGVLDLLQGADLASCEREPLIEAAYSVLHNADEIGPQIN